MKNNEKHAAHPFARPHLFVPRCKLAPEVPNSPVEDPSEGTCLGGAGAPTGRRHICAHGAEGVAPDRLPRPPGGGPPHEERTPELRLMKHAKRGRHSSLPRGQATREEKAGSMAS